MQTICLLWILTLERVESIINEVCEIAEIGIPNIVIVKFVQPMNDFLNDIDMN